MAKKSVDLDSLIHIELTKLEDKVNQFQDYLEMNTIVTQVTSESEIILTEENQDKLHKEILIQIKMQDALFNWLPLLKKLKETELNKEVEVRGDGHVGNFFKGKE